MDSNHRTRKGRDLQSPAFGHFANPPKNGGADGIRTRGLLRDRQAC